MDPTVAFRLWVERTRNRQHAAELLPYRLELVSAPSAAPRYVVQATTGNNYSAQSAETRALLADLFATMAGAHPPVWLTAADVHIADLVFH